MNSFVVRAFSAIAALLALGGIYYFFNLLGLHIIVFLVILLGGRELIKILFLPTDTHYDRGLFYVSLIMIYALSVRFFERAAVVYVCVSVFYFSLNLWRHRSETNLSSISSLQAKSLLGFFYLGLLPVFADRLLLFSNGLAWFLVLLAVVFSGDSFAYIFGMTWGRHKIMPAISPKKSAEGSIGGLLGSVFASIVASYFLPLVPLYALIIMGLTVGLIGQFGDFFESLLKRVAEVKDSGSIMPGHGGVLDRLDGVLFAAPFVYLTASLFEYVDRFQ